MDFFYCEIGDTPTKTSRVNLHIKASVNSAIFLAMHAVLLSIVYAIKDKEKWFEEMVPMTIYYTEGIVNLFGWVACAFLFVLWLSARPRVIDSWYSSVFLPVHVTAAVCFILASNLHDYSALMMAWPALAEILCCRLMRRFSERDEVLAEIQSLDGLDDVVRVKAQTPSTWNDEIRSGRHVFIDGHPFSVSSFGSDEFTLHVKARGYWTNNLIRSVEDGTKSRTVKVEGLYGSNLTPLSTAPTCCVFVAGGIGVTGLAEAIHTCVERRIPIQVIWIVHSSSLFESLGRELLWTRRLLMSIQDGSSAKFEVYVTKNEPEGTLRQDFAVNRHVDISLSRSTSPTTSTQAKLSPLVVALVVLVCMATSFYIARQLCCSQSTSPVTCGMANGLWTQKCRSCDMDAVRLDDPGEELPCCRSEICYLCFRGLTVVLAVVVAPALASLILWIFASFHHAQRVCRFISARGQRKGYHSPVSAAQEIVAVDSAITIENVENSQQSSFDVGFDEKEDEEELESQVSRMPSDLVTIYYERPCIRTVLHSLWSTHEDEANETNSSIYVCGPQRLNDAVREEVERQQKQNLAHQYKLIVL